MKRRTLEETWTLLEGDGWLMPRDTSGVPFVPAAMPRQVDEEPLGFSFLRTRLVDADLSHLTLPRTFCSRSLFERVDFRNTDIVESRLCWNDFVHCDFSGANLTGCDLRASIYRNCNFSDAIFELADMRASTYEHCDFTGAQFRNAIGHRASAKKQGLLGCLSVEQKASMRWHYEPGEDVSGG
jgi:uncharacterized protein YjbI with pentapeptide repeats